jgi:hypothetical protein
MSHPVIFRHVKSVTGTSNYGEQKRIWVEVRAVGGGSKYRRIADASGIQNPDLVNPGRC